MAGFFTFASLGGIARRDSVARLRCEQTRHLLARRLLLLGHLVLEPPVVHDAADRRVGACGNLDQVEPLLLGETQRLVSREDPELLAVIEDDTDLGNADAVVDSILLGRSAITVSLGSASACRWWSNGGVLL
jgi:hypothetical protein